MTNISKDVCEELFSINESEYGITLKLNDDTIVDERHYDSPKQESGVSYNEDETMSMYYDSGYCSIDVNIEKFLELMKKLGVIDYYDMNMLPDIREIIETLQPGKLSNVIKKNIETAKKNLDFEKNDKDPSEYLVNEAKRMLKSYEEAKEDLDKFLKEFYKDK